MNSLGAYCLAMATYIYKGKYETFTNRYNGIDSLTMLSEG